MLLRSAWLRLGGAFALPIGVAAAWMPLRDHLPNTDLALALVLVIGLAGWWAGTRASIVSALGAAAAFDFLDSRPYGTLAMSRVSDVTTALILLLTGSAIGLGSARLARLRHSEDHRSDALAVVMEVSGLVATGSQDRLIAEAMGEELSRALDLRSWELHLQPPGGIRPTVARDGGLVGMVATGEDPYPSLIDLPIWCQGEVVAHYRLALGARKPTREELRVALSLADQAGAAMAGVGRPATDPTPPRRTGRLRLIPHE